MYDFHFLEPDPCHDEDGHPISGHPFEKPGDCDNYYIVRIEFLVGLITLINLNEAILPKHLTA